MTFIDVSQEHPTPGIIAGYSVLCVVSCLCAYWAVNIGRSRQHYQSFFSVRVLFPIALFILALENAALAASGKIYDSLIAEGNDDADFDDSLFIKAVFVLQTFEVPILLIVIFEITYLVHKRRSVNFCGMYFDDGVRVKNTAYMSNMLRNSIRTLATFLVVMGLMVNFNFFKSGTKTIDDLAGRVGWWALTGEDWESRLYLMLSLIPSAVLILVALYLSVMLWRYGTESSMVVHSSICNPWFYPFFGTVAMGASQLFTEKLYTIMSNAGLLVFIITIILVMTEIDKDMIATNDVAWFLVSVAKSGDQIRVVDPVTSLSMQPQQHIIQHREEEKRPEDEESGVEVLTQNDTEGSGNNGSILPDQGAEVSSASMEDDRGENITHEVLSKSVASPTPHVDIDQENEAAHDEENRFAAAAKLSKSGDGPTTHDDADEENEAAHDVDADEENEAAHDVENGIAATAAELVKYSKEEKVKRVAVDGNTKVSGPSSFEEFELWLCGKEVANTAQEAS